MEGFCMLPEEPAVLLSFINMKLRDFYSDLDDLCEDMDADKEDIIRRLSAAGYCYDEAENQFKGRG